MSLFVEVKKNFFLFCTGTLQVFFVSMNTYFLSYSLAVAVFLTSFMISLIWSFNVKRIAFGTMADRIAYALGAAVGAVIGLLTAESLHLWFINS